MTLRCLSCEKPIDFQRTASGVKMPVDPDFVRYEDAAPGTVFVTESGVTVKVDPNKPRPGVRGRISHFATCANPNKHRRANAK